MFAVVGVVRMVPVEEELTEVWWQSKVSTQEHTASRQKSRLRPDLSHSLG
jgi:hypothetical protein